MIGKFQYLELMAIPTSQFWPILLTDPDLKDHKAPQQQIIAKGCRTLGDSLVHSRYVPQNLNSRFLGGLRDPNGVLTFVVIILYVNIKCYVSLHAVARIQYEPHSIGNAFYYLNIIGNILIFPTTDRLFHN